MFNNHASHLYLTNVLIHLLEMLPLQNLPWSMKGVHNHCGTMGQLTFLTLIFMRTETKPSNNHY